MERRHAALVLLAVIALAGLLVAKRAEAPESLSMSFTIKSGAFEPGGLIPARHTCDGENMSPPLLISGTPAGTASLALVMDDPDAPAGTWVHWVLYDMPPGLSAIGEGETPPGTLGVGTSGASGYRGPCPPDREHRYFFRLYALDAPTGLSAGATKADLERAIEGHVLDVAELMGRYDRPR